MHAAANICTCKNGIAATGNLYVHARACALVCVCACVAIDPHTHPCLEFGVLDLFHRIVSPRAHTDHHKMLMAFNLSYTCVIGARKTATNSALRA